MLIQIIRELEKFKSKKIILKLPEPLQILRSLRRILQIVYITTSMGTQFRLETKLPYENQPTRSNQSRGS